MDEISHFVSRYPRVFHMAEEGSWDSIRKHGLLSTTALLDLYEQAGRERFAIESQWRRESVTVSHPSHGTAVIRDQKPMPPNTLEGVLEGLKPRDWYEFLNRKTFFWVTEERLRRLLGAKNYRDRPHDVLQVDSRRLLEAHMKVITVSPINSGVSAFGPRHRRSFATFMTLESWHGRQRSQDLAELAVDYAVPKIEQFVLSVRSWRGSQPQGIIWEP